MRTNDILLVAAYAIVSTTAIMIIKQYVNPAVEAWKISPGISAAGGLLVLGAVLYAASFLVWVFILSRNELSIVYPLVIGLTLITTTLAANVFLGEGLTLLRLVGIVVIFVGIFLVTRS